MRNLSFIVCLVFVSNCIAADWPQWRGPAFNGSTEQTGLPNKLTEETLHWSTPMLGVGASTPIVVNGRIFHTSTQDGSSYVHAMCLNSETGETLWSKTVSIEARNPARNNFASCSPVAYDGGAVYMFGSGRIFRLDADGNTVWDRSLPDNYESFSRLNYGYSATPLLYNDKLYITVLRQHAPDAPDELRSFLLCLNAADGKTVFKHTRITDAVREGNDAYSSPLLATVNGKPQIIIAGADYVTAHDSEIGAELWRYCYDHGHNPMGRLVPTPAVDKNMLVSTFPRGTKTFAFDLEIAVAGEPAPVWTSESAGPDVTSPTIYKGHVYIIDDRKQKTLTCLDLATGVEKWTGQLDKSDAYYASPTAADDKLYLVNRKGEVSVIAADPKEFKILSTSIYNEPYVDSTIVAADGKLLLRTAKNLYCFKTK